MICSVKLLQKKWSESRGGKMPTGKKKSRQLLDGIPRYIDMAIYMKTFSSQINMSDSLEGKNLIK